MGIKVYSEIGNLKKVLLHRPGLELENLAPAYLVDLLFDDIPYLAKAQEEHDQFAKTLRDNGVEVKYILELVEEALSTEAIKSQFLNEFIELSDVNNTYIRDALYDNLMALSTKEMLTKLVSGIRTNALDLKKEIFSIKVRKEKADIPFFLNPLPNLYFQRDPVAMVGKGGTINRMRTPARRRESMFMEYVMKYHPEYNETPAYYEKNLPYALEGGDVLVFDSSTIGVGISQRTDPEALEILGKKIFYQYGDSFDTILGFLIPAERAFMHLDTVFTMVDHDKFVVHSKLQDIMKVFVLKKAGNNDFIIEEETDSLERILEKHLKLEKATIIKCGDGDDIAAAREQWNDGSNCLAIAPGKVIAYDRNYITNALLRKAGVTVLEIPSSELSRGRGGPRCMSMPLYRE